MENHFFFMVAPHTSIKASCLHTSRDKANVHLHVSGFNPGAAIIYLLHESTTINVVIYSRVLMYADDVVFNHSDVMVTVLWALIGRSSPVDGGH